MATFYSKDRKTAKAEIVDPRLEEYVTHLEQIARAANVLVESMKPKPTSKEADALFDALVEVNFLYDPQEE